MTNVWDFREWTDLSFEFGRVVNYTWWLDSIDKKLAKPDLWDLIVFTGYPSMGKTEFTLFMAQRNVLEGNRVAYLSLELTKKDLLQRSARKYAWVSYQDFQNGKYTEQQIDIMKSKLKDLQLDENKFWIVWAKKEPTMEQLEILIRECSDKGYRMIFIDNLWKIEWCATDLERQASVTSRLQDLKNELNLCIVLMHHLRKPWKDNIFSPWWGNAFSGSQKIKDNCSVMVEIRRDLDPYQTDEERRKVKLIQYKQTRDGITWLVDIVFEKGSYIEVL